LPYGAKATEEAYFSPQRKLSFVLGSDFILFYCHAVLVIFWLPPRAFIFSNGKDVQLKPIQARYFPSLVPKKQNVLLFIKGFALVAETLLSQMKRVMIGLFYQYFRYGENPFLRQALFVSWILYLKD